MRLDRAERRVRRRLRLLPLEGRAALLRALALPDGVRAETIGRMYKGADYRERAEVLMDIEAEPMLRLDLMQALKDSVPAGERKRGR